MSYIPELQEELTSDRLTLFVGAGVSLSSGLPSWQGLVERLAKRAGIQADSTDNTDSLLVLAQQAKDQLGEGYVKQNILFDIV